jgi:hypothetical protein
MNHRIKLIKKSDNKTTEAKPAPEPVAEQNRWSKAVRLWVEEFKRERVEATPPAFNRLFKDAMPG